MSSQSRAVGVVKETHPGETRVALSPEIAKKFVSAGVKVLIERGAVIGSVFDAWMMIPDWKRGVTKAEEAGLLIERIVDHIDHICQIAGSSLHCGIGSDLDGAFGFEQTPADLKSISDLQRLPELLARRGYKEQDVENIMHGNFLRFLRNAWKG